MAELEFDMEAEEAATLVDSDEEAAALEEFIDDHEDLAEEPSEAACSDFVDAGSQPIDPKTAAPEETREISAAIKLLRSQEYLQNIQDHLRICKICILLPHSNLGNFTNLRQNFVDFC